MNKSNIINFLRWVGVLPAAFIAPVIGCILCIAVLLLGDLMTGDIWWQLQHPEIFSVEHFFTSFVVFGIFGALAVFAGASMAPKYRKAVSFVLFAIIAVVFGFIAILMLLLNNFAEVWRPILNCIVCIAAAGITAFNSESIYDDIND